MSGNECMCCREVFNTHSLQKEMRMKTKQIGSCLILLAVLLIGFNGTSIAATMNFNLTPASSVLISEDSGIFTGKVNYSISNPADITSATLSIVLSDDSSSFFPLGAPGTVIDAPREIARLTSVRDGTTSIFPFAEAEVDPHFFGPQHPTHLTARTAGIEEPSVAPSDASYFNLDVTDLIKNSNSGMLEFSLIAPDLFEDILPGTLTYNLIVGDAAGFGILLPPNVPLPVHEDFLFKSAQLNVAVVPIPAAIWLFGSSLLGLQLLFSRRKQT